MENAIKYIEQMNSFVDALITAGYSSVAVQKGRRFDKVLTHNMVRYFVEKSTGNIYGAKSSLQYNPRRRYGTLDTIMQYDWKTNMPLPNTEAEHATNVREAYIMAGYKKRGRPKKVVTP